MLRQFRRLGRGWATVVVYETWGDLLFEAYDPATTCTVTLQVTLSCKPMQLLMTFSRCEGEAAFRRRTLTSASAWRERIMEMSRVKVFFCCCTMAHVGTVCARVLLQCLPNVFLTHLQASLREALQSLWPNRAATAAFLRAARTGNFPRKLLRQV